MKPPATSRVTRPVPWNRRRTGILAAAAASLAALTCATDLLVEHTTEQRIIARATRRLKPDGQVHVDLTTPLAGLRTLGGQVGDVEVSAKGVRRRHTVMDVTVHLEDVTTAGDSAGGTATATVGYDRLTRRLGALGNGLTARAQDGDLLLDGTVGRLGLPVTVRCHPSVTAHAFTLTPTTVSVLGRSVAVDDLSTLPAASALRDGLRPHTVPVTGLPHGVTLASARATAEGLALTFSIAAGPTPGTADAPATAAAGQHRPSWMVASREP